MEWEQLLVREAEKRLGPPDKPRTLQSADELLGTHHQDLQMVYPLAWLYAVPAGEFRNNPWREHPAVLRAVELLMEKILSQPVGRRFWYPLFHAYGLLRTPLGLRGADLARRMRAAFFEQMWPELVKRERLTALSSANVGYGTNHLAVEVSALTAYIKVFGAEPDFATGQPSGDRLRGAADLWLEKFFAYMHPDGYWAECDGPADGYNSLTASALLRAVLDIGCLERYRQHLAIAGRYGSLSALPDGSGVDISNGRTNFVDKLGEGIRKSYGALSPNGKHLRDFAMAAGLKQCQEAAPLTGENQLECLCNILSRKFENPTPTRSVWADENLDVSLSSGFHYHKRGSWITAASTFFSMPRPEGHWNLDYQNLMCLYHARTGLILLGANGKNDLEAATFHKIFGLSDSLVVRETDLPNMRKHIPYRGRYDRTAAGWKLWREYRGFEGLLEFARRSDTEVALTVNANAREDDYPITCTLLPALVFGESFTDGSGRARTIGAEPFDLTGEALGGALELRRKSVPVRLTLPSEAHLRWPYKVWDPYNLKTDRYEKIEDQTVLLDLPVGSKGVTLTFTVGA